MSLIDNNTLFFLRGDCFKDLSPNNVIVTPDSINSSQLENDKNGEHDVKCINFSNTGCLKFVLDSGYLSSSHTVAWWEKDTNIKKTGATGVFTNCSASSGSASMGLLANSNMRSLVNLSSNGTSYFVQDKPFGNDVQDIWIHRAMIFNKDESKYKFYENGVKVYEYDGPACKSGTGSYNNFQMGRFRVSQNALMKKIYNFEVVVGEKWSSDFTPDPKQYFDDGGGTTPPPGGGEQAQLDPITITALSPEATLMDILDKTTELSTANNLVRGNLAKILIAKGINASDTETVMQLLDKINKGL